MLGAIESFRKLFDERWNVIEIEEQETQKYRVAKPIIYCVAQNNKPAGE